MSVMSDQVSRGPKGRGRYAIDYIPDPALFKAVMFALRIMRVGTTPAIANTRAAEYYGVSVPDVAHYTGQAAGTCAHRRRRSR